MVHRPDESPESLWRLPEPPRRIRLRRWSVLADFAPRAFFSALFGGAASLVLFLAILASATYLFGIDIPGKILDVKFEQASGKRTHDQYRVTYQFRAGDEPVTRQTFIDAGQVPALPFELKTGAPAPVRLLRLLPRISSDLATPKDPLWGLLLFLLFAVGWATFGCFVPYACWRDVWLQWRLVKYGREAHERIGDLQVRKGSKTGPRLDITFSYPCGVATMSVPAYWHDGSRHSGSGLSGFAPCILRGMARPIVQVGDPVTVLYDPSHTSRATVYEFSFFRC